MKYLKNFGILVSVLIMSIASVAQAQFFVPTEDGNPLPADFQFVAPTFGEVVHFLFPVMSVNSPSITEQSVYDTFVSAEGGSGSTPTNPSTPPVSNPPTQCIDAVLDFEAPITPNAESTSYDSHAVSTLNTNQFMAAICQRAINAATSQCQKYKLNITTANVPMVKKLCDVICAAKNVTACPSSPTITDRGAVCSVVDTHQVYMGSMSLSWCRATVSGVARGTLDCHCGGQ